MREAYGSIRCNFVVFPFKIPIFSMSDAISLPAAKAELFKSCRTYTNVIHGRCTVAESPIQNYLSQHHKNIRSTSYY